MSKNEGQILDFMSRFRRKSPGLVKGIGLCALFSRQGDWAFDYAFKLARFHETKLSIFHFLESPYVLRRDVVFLDADRKTTIQVTPELVTAKEKEMREAFDDRLGDYVNVGFRLCEGNDEFELRKCFRKRDFEVLVIGYERKKAAFGGSTTIEAFADKFRGPVVLIGPDRPDSYYLNDPAKRRLADLMIPQINCHNLNM